MRLRTAEDEYELDIERDHGKAPRRGAEAVLNVWLAQDKAPPHVPKSSLIAPTVQAIAYVNHGRWVVECPFCPSAQVASTWDRRFFCTDCGNAAVGGGWIEVVWPGEADEIDAALADRPRVNANWRGETVAALRAENTANGLGA